MKRDTNQGDDMNRKVEYDYEFQCWAVDGVVQCCGHQFRCNCTGRLYEGLAIAHLYSKRNNERASATIQAL